MIRVIAVGKNRDKSLQDLQREYIKRITAFSKIEVIEVKDEPNNHMERESEWRIVKEKEGGRVLDRLKGNDFVVLLDLHGDMWDSQSFAMKFNQWQSSFSHIVFVIAGSLGPGEKLIQRANVRWKISDLTFTHLMARVLVLEQIYRAFMINHHRNYHK